MHDLPLIVLAAGRSSRFGSPKGLWRLQGEPLLRVQLRRFEAAGGRAAVVVLGPDADRYLEAVPELAGRSEPSTLRLSTTRAPCPEDGPFASLRLGIVTAMSWAPRGVWVLPVDVPAPTPATFAALLDAFAPGVAAVTPTREGRGGHPVLLSAAFAASLAQVATGPDARLDAQLRALDRRGERRRVEVPDPAVSLDLDTFAEAEAYAASVVDAPAKAKGQ
jgi:molybdenum cofactor cytidylyltransferase